MIESQQLIPTFAAGQSLKATDLQALSSSLGSLIRNSQHSVNRPLNLQVIMQADLFAAVNTKKDPSTAPARVLRKKPNGDMTLTAETITIVNRFMHISVDAGTYAKAEWIDGEWQLYAADCSAGSSSGP